MVEDDDLLEGELSPMKPADPVRRLAAAIILQAAIDFTKALDPRSWNDAQKFIFVENPEFHRNAEAAGLNANWIRESLLRMRDQAARATHSCRNCGPLPVTAFSSNRNSPNGLRTSAGLASVREQLLVGAWPA